MDANPELWTRYLAGSRAFDERYSAGERCPSNATGAKCLCEKPEKKICQIWRAVVGIAEKIGGETWNVVQKIE